MIIQNIIRIPYGKIGYLLEFSMAYHHAMDGPCEKRQLTIIILLKAYLQGSRAKISMGQDLIKGSVYVF